MVSLPSDQALPEREPVHASTGYCAGLLPMLK